MTGQRPTRQALLLLLTAILALRPVLGQNRPVINEFALQVDPSLQEQPFVEVFCPAGTAGPVHLLRLGGDAGVNPGLPISSFDLKWDATETDAFFSVALQVAPGTSETLILLDSGLYGFGQEASDTSLVAQWNTFRPNLTIDVGVATSGPGRVAVFSSYEVTFADTALTRSIATELKLPFRVVNLTKGEQIETFVPDINRNGEWDLDERIIFIENLDQVETATWQVDLHGFPEPGAGDVLSIWILPTSDLDADDDGHLDYPIRLGDSVSINDGATGCLGYSETILVPAFDGDDRPPLGASRVVDGVDTDSVEDWIRNDIDGFLEPHEVSVSPGQSNSGGGVGAEQLPVLSAGYRLAQNYPNPFNPTTTISYVLPEPAGVTLTVVDLLGRQVRVLVSQSRPAGPHEVTFDATGLPSGVYFYRLAAGHFAETRSLILAE